MSQLVVLDLDGDFGQGFRVCAQIFPNHQENCVAKKRCELPANPELKRILELWQLEYRNYGSGSRIKVQKVHVSKNPQKILKLQGQQLRLSFQRWLTTESFRQLDIWLRQKLPESESGRILICSNIQLVHQLPWEQWDLVKQYPWLGITFGQLEFNRVPPKVDPRRKKQVRILAIFGSSDKLNLEKDRNLLQDIKQAKIKVLEQPTRETLDRYLWEQNWDVISFSGHSQTVDSQGIIHLNQHEILSINELEYAFRQAVANGLRLAIFNSCDGLGLAYGLGNLGLPNVIVMREPIMDSVAQLFLKHLITEYSSGHSLHLATRRAREKLQVIETEHPFSTWLPLLYQNQAAKPLLWSELLSPQSTNLKDRSSWLLAHALGAISAAAIVWLVQSLGWLQAGELANYDRALSMRPAEARDERITIVTVSEKDIQYQQQQGMTMRGSLADEALNALLLKIQPYQPVAIASDILHDFSYGSALEEQIVRQNNFIAVCRVGNSKTQPVLESVSSPPGIAIQNTGFSNLPVDRDRVIRRHIVGMAADEQCQNSLSLAANMAFRYLDYVAPQKLGQDFYPSGIKDGLWQVGEFTFPRLNSRSGAYRLPNSENQAYQLLINYRDRSPQTVALQEILEETSSSKLEELFASKMVFIGVQDQNNDSKYIPHRNGQKRSKAPGVLVHAQAASQIVSAVLDGRLLIRWLPCQLESVWVFGWSVIGSIVVIGYSFLKRDSKYRVSVITVSMVIVLGLLYFAYYSFLVFGYWLPIVAPSLGLLLAGLISATISYKQSSWTNNQYQKELR